MHNCSPLSLLSQQHSFYGAFTLLLPRRIRHSFLQAPSLFFLYFNITALMRVSLPVALTGAALVSLATASNCISSGDETVINAAFSAGGAGTIVQLCASAVITIHNTITFTADNQELSTQGYPTGDTRGTIILNAQGTNVTALIEGSSRHGIRLLNIQVDGNRAGNGVMNIGMNQIVGFGQQPSKLIG